MPAPTPTEAFLGRLGHRYAATGRAVVGVLAALLAPLAGPPIGVGPASIVSAAFIAWSAVYLRLLWSGSRRRWWVLDVAVLCALGLAQPWLVDPALVPEFLSWVSPVVSFAVVALQWHVRAAVAVPVTLLVTAAYVIGAEASDGVSWSAALVPAGVWIPVEAALSRVLWGLVRRGGRRADALLAERFADERRAATEAARRADQRLHWAAVHDTSASTLLMVGLGEVRGDEPWLPGQIGRDLAALGGEPDPGGDVALAALLDEVARSGALEVRFTASALPPVPSPVAGALSGAVREALENVRRHAGVTAATVRAEADGPRVRVLVNDTGRGFDPAAVAPGRTGLAVSVRERMARVGGRATVRSVPGGGACVELEWGPDGMGPR